MKAQWLLYVPPSFNIKISNTRTRAYSRACLQFQDKQLLFPYTTFIYWFLQQRHCLFTVQYEVNLKIKFILILMFKIQYFFKRIGLENNFRKNIQATQKFLAPQGQLATTSIPKTRKYYASAYKI